ncbi:MAG: ribosome small subunit-dependent GTPase A [Thermoanaerobaculia bacterium]
MDRIEKRHKKDLEKRVDYEEMKLRKRAGSVRRSLRKGKAPREQRVTEDNWEELFDQKSSKAERAPSLEAIVSDLRRGGTHQTETYGGAQEGAAIVINVASGRCRVFAGGSEIDCTVPPEIAVQQKSALAVGDRVRVATSDGVHRIEAVLPRRSVLARPDPLHAHRQRLIAANIDVVAHVVSVKAPPLRPRLIDRFLIAIQRGGAQPVICVNKIDALNPAQREEELAKLAAYRDLGVPVIPCSAQTGEGLDLVRQCVEGKTCALVGHSGVGKSSILNALDERLQLATNALHRRGTGRHTTSASTLYDFGGGTYLIDTPGIREFGLWDLDRSSLRDYFPEFEEPTELCRFTDCTHVHEPDCEVKRRVEDGTLNRARYDTYVRLYNDLEN